MIEIFKVLLDKKLTLGLARSLAFFLKALGIAEITWKYLKKIQLIP